MILRHVLHAELLKMKRTIALKLVVLSPAAVVLLMLFVVSQAPFTTLNFNRVQNKWTVLSLLTLRVWALLMMPLYITLQAALVAGLDHSENQWKSLLVRAVPRWTLYISKLTVVAAMTAISTLILLCGIFIDGLILSKIQSEVLFGFPIPWSDILRDGLQIIGLAFLALTIQHWVSMRWRSFSVAVGVGMVATVTGVFAVAAAQPIGWTQYFPWALPVLVVTREHHNVEATLLASWALGVGVAVAGCLDFCKREAN